jgi:hypothetical protein
LSITVPRLFALEDRFAVPTSRRPVSLLEARRNDSRIFQLRRLARNHNTQMMTVDNASVPFYTASSTKCYQLTDCDDRNSHGNGNANDCAGREIEGALICPRISTCVARGLASNAAIWNSNTVLTAHDGGERSYVSCRTRR